VPGYPTAYVKRATTLYRKPEGKPLVRIAARTQWGSPRVLGVVRREGSWLAVQAPELRNGQVGWIPDATAQVDGTAFSVDVDVSRRTVVVRRSGRQLRRFTVAVGQSRHPTPLGRYSVTDKLNVKSKGSPYGCCVVALTGHQTHLPADWPGGDRLAIHATTDEKSIGRPVSLGCMRTNGRVAKWLIKTLPIGTPVFIRS
jgi:lipoprotein-anchoring transpeptidase ErfK/SrfK